MSSSYIVNTAILPGAVYKAEIAHWRLMQKKKEMDEALQNTAGFLNASSHSPGFHENDLPMVPNHASNANRYEIPPMQYAEARDHGAYRQRYEPTVDHGVPNHTYTMEKARDYSDNSPRHDHRYRDDIQYHHGHNGFTDDHGRSTASQDGRGHYVDYANVDHRYPLYNGKAPDEHDRMAASQDGRGHCADYANVDHRYPLHNGKASLSTYFTFI